MVSIQTLLDKFWDPDIWLPPNITWADLQSSDQIEYTHHKDLLYPIPMALLVFVIRYCFEKYCFIPIGTALGIKGSKPKRAVHNEILERAFKQNLKMKHKDISGLAKQLDWTERQVERWLRLRRAQDKPSTIVKFTENGWRFTYYASSFSFGLYVLWDKPWLWDTDLCWHNYPHQGVSRGVWWYYMTSAAFYWSLMGSQFFDVKRKDFWQMFAHHVLTLFLLALSWVCNFHRIGSLTILLHDFADIFLEFAKMAKYAKYQKLCDTVFAIFTISWLVTRTGIFPFILIYSTTVRGPIIVNTPMFPAYYIFNGLLFFLLGLHLFWTYLILKLAKSALSAGQMEGDIRSSSSDFSDTSANSALVSGDINSTPSPKKSPLK
ncbi:ceramide synthase 6-like [Macrosteles quadrilineatus]|uniref:ceramide synthase 6-like n=1 Tax=Macrosteles quadrilineatus TaxID=74068 RepID=UPI0023E29ADD|nr:ceramide synthase 6-like [Macrosteles quadrilineatus]XP_054267659.1 ceramide synthase 6-like [Macrosteles quadrilineatus]